MNQCTYCDQPTYFPDMPVPYCQRHHEIKVLVSRAFRQGLPETTETMAMLKARSRVRWLISDEEIPGLLADVKARDKATP
jgi:hypothetical protein